MIDPATIKLKFTESLLKIEASQWEALQAQDFPFTDYAFLVALERNNCLGTRTGWKPCHITAWSSDDLVGALVLYSRTNSYGEYIFDFNWAEASITSGIPYYPKLTSAIPFTPATGSKILLSKHLSEALKMEVQNLLLTEAPVFLEKSESSSLHFLFLPEAELSILENTKYFTRHSFQYHWKNHSYENFEDFLSRLKSKRRREIIRERNQVKDQGIRIQWLRGHDLTKEHAHIMYNFYQSTLEKKQGLNYLTLEFFEEIFETMREKILFVLGSDSTGQPVAGALNLIGENRLFGRHWGCLENYRSLHFEICYYQGIDFCIQNKLEIFEAGAQGEHKFHRGFLPTLTYSAHQIRQPELSQAVKHFVELEKRDIKELFNYYEKHSPFSQITLTESISRLKNT